MVRYSQLRETALQNIAATTFRWRVIQLGTTSIAWVIAEVTVGETRFGLVVDVGAFALEGREAEPRVHMHSVRHHLRGDSVQIRCLVGDEECNMSSISPANNSPDPVSVTISPALLDRLKSQHQTFGIPGLLQGPSPKADDAKALVLFKPLTISPQPTADTSHVEEEQDLKVVTKTDRTCINGVSSNLEDADMMDIEML